MKRIRAFVAQFDFQDLLAASGLAMVGGALYLAVGTWLALLVVGGILFWGGVRPPVRKS